MLQSELHHFWIKTEASQVTNWHTVKLIKQGNTFTCYVDRTNVGYISYKVAAGLPDTTGKDIYSGIYTFNDEIIVSAYDVTTVNGFTSPSLPAEAGNPINASVNPPVLGTYNEYEAVDEFVNPIGPDGNEDQVDATKPTVSITTSTTANVGDEVEVKYSASDNVTASDNLVVEITVTKDSQTIQLTNNKFVAEAGSYTITVKVTDEAGNSQTATITVNVEAGENVNPNPNPEPAKKGCFGGITVSMLSVLVLSGAILVLRKKKED